MECFPNGVVKCSPETTLNKLGNLTHTVEYTMAPDDMKRNVETIQLFCTRLIEDLQPKVEIIQKDDNFMQSVVAQLQFFCRETDIDGKEIFGTAALSAKWEALSEKTKKGEDIASKDLMPFVQFAWRISEDIRDVVLKCVSEERREHAERSKATGSQGQKKRTKDDVEAMRSTMRQLKRPTEPKENP